jgi:hypothetical protein
MSRANNSPMMSWTSPPERFTGPGDHDYANVWFIAQGGKRFRQLPVNFERDRIQPLGPIQGDRRDARLPLFVKKALGFVHALRGSLKTSGFVFFSVAWCDFVKPYRSRSKAHDSRNHTKSTK